MKATLTLAGKRYSPLHESGSAVPAWFSNRLKRLVRTPKRYLVDPALVSAVIEADADTVLLVELSGHRVIALEIKASALFRREDARHLAWLRDELDDRFVHGLLLHTGEHMLPLGDRITAAPICTLWS